jgi:hypothetical protein
MKPRQRRASAALPHKLAPVGVRLTFKVFADLLAQAIGGRPWG